MGRILRAGINVVTTGDFLTGTHHPKERAALEAAALGGRRDVPRHRFRTGVRQRRGGLSVRCMPSRVQRETDRDAGLHRIPGSGGLDGARVRQAGQGSAHRARPRHRPIRPWIFETLDLVADMLGIELESKQGLVERALATRDLDLGGSRSLRAPWPGNVALTAATAMDASSLNWRSAGP